MKWNVGTRIATGFGLALAIFLLVGAASYVATTDLIRASDQRRHSFTVLARLGQVLPLLKDAELGTRNYLLTEDASYAESARVAADRVLPLLAELRRLTADAPRQQQRLAAMEPIVRSRLEEARELVALHRAGGQQAAVARIRSGQGADLNAQIARLLGELETEQRTLLQARSAAADHNAGNARWTILGGTLLALVLALAAGGLIARDLSRSLGALTQVAERIRRGDIAVSVPGTGRSDEVGVLARAFEGMTQYLQAIAGAAERMAAGDLRTAVTPYGPDDVLATSFVRMSDNLRQQIRGMVEAADVLGASASGIVASTSQLAAGAIESAAAVAETTATVEEVRQTAELANEKARHVCDSAQRAVHGAQSGRKATEDAGAGMLRIRHQMDGIAASMARLSEHSQTIGQIIATVEDLAVQSNLLAVNAAIEAAKAGEHGKGFAVVAQEVKSLAAQSRHATGEVRGILGEIQAATASAVLATQQGGQAVEAGGRQTETASGAIQALAGSINEAAQAATQIAASSQQQLVGVDQVAGAMESIKQASSQNMASARQLETAARDLDALGRRLKQAVAAYAL